MNTWPFPTAPVIPWTRKQQQEYDRAQREKEQEAPF